MFNLNAPFYDAGFVYAGASIPYDFNKGMYGTVADATMLRESVR